MKICILVFLLFIVSVVNTEDIKECKRLTDGDFESLEKSAEFNLEKTRDEALKDMKRCVIDSNSLAFDIYSFSNDLKLEKVPDLVRKAIKCVKYCESFKYLKLDSECEERVNKTFTHLKLYSDLFKLLKSTTRIKVAFHVLQRDFKLIKETCVADPDALQIY